MKIRPLFDQFQRQIVWFANTRAGRQYLGANRNLPIVGVYPDGIHYLKELQGDEATILAEFYPRSPYLKKLAKPLEYGLVGASLLASLKQPLFLPLIMGTTSTTYPDPDPESTTVDGWVRYDTTGTTWNTAVTNSAGHTANDTDANQNFAASYWLTGTSRAQIYRGFFLFDTSSIPAGASISSAVMSLYGSGSSDGDNDANAYTVVVETAPASNTALATGDYDSAGATELSDTIDTSSWNTSGYNDYTLNASGLALIIAGGITKLGLREGHDLNNDQPTSGTDNGPSGYFADQTGTANDPKLVVEYSVASGGFFYMTI